MPSLPPRCFTVSGLFHMAKAKPKPARKVGRPLGSGVSTYTAAMGAAICQRIETGEPLAAICRGDGMPGARTVYDWMEVDSHFAAAIARARVVGHDAIAAECLAIADTHQVGVQETEKADGSLEYKRADMIEHRKLRIHTRLQLLAKWDPKRYGDKLELSGDKNNPVLPPADVARRIVFLLAQAKDAPKP